VGASRMVYAMTRDSYGERGPGKVSRWGTPTYATAVITAMTVAIYVVIFAASHVTSAAADNAFAWSGTIGTLILLVAYLLATIGMTLLVFVRRKMPGVPNWQIAIPVAAVVVLGYTLYRNVWPYPTGDGHWFPIIGGIWLAVAIVAVIALPGTARRLGKALTSDEGIAVEEPAPFKRGVAAGDGVPAAEV
jgi:amino acid transporter